MVFVILGMVYALGYHHGLMISPGKRVPVEVDWADSKVTAKESSYDPYFTKANFTKVVFPKVSFTNANPVPAKVK